MAQSLITTWLGTGSINVFALPFGGKDTQCQLLERDLSASLLGSGQILRDTSALSPEATAMMERGELIPREDFLGIVVPVLEDPVYAGRPLILSSVGRFYGEQEVVSEALAVSGHPIKSVILLEVSVETALARHVASQASADRGQRADDDPAALPVRFNEFEAKTRPVIDWYAKQGLLIRVDGEGSPVAVYEQIQTELQYMARYADYQAKRT